MPEGVIPLAQGVTYLASAPKSNASYRAMLAAREDVRKLGGLPVPMHLRNAPTPLMRETGLRLGLPLSARLRRRAGHAGLSARRSAIAPLLRAVGSRLRNPHPGIYPQGQGPAIRLRR